MANNQNLKDAIADVIKANGNNEITGSILQNALFSIINQFGSGAVFAGMASPDTIPQNNDVVSFYIAYQKGVYANFGGYDNNDGSLVIFSNKSGVYEQIASFNVSGIQYLQPIEPGTENDPAILPSVKVSYKYMFEAAPGYYKQGTTIFNAEKNKRWIFFAENGLWSLKDMGELPYNPANGEVALNDQNAPSGDKIKKALNAQYLKTIFTNVLYGSNYTSWTRATRGNPSNNAVVSINAEGKRQIDVIADGISAGFSMGIGNNYIVPANTPTTIEILFKLEGITATDFVKYFIYSELGVRKIEHAEFEVSGQYLKVWKVINKVNPITLELLGVQKEATTILPTAIKIILEEGVIEKTETILGFNTLKNIQSQRIEDFINNALIPKGTVTIGDLRTTSGDLTKKAINEEVDTVKLSSPLMNPSQYTSYTRMNKGIATNDAVTSINSEGKRQVDVPAGGISNGINGGIAGNYIVTGGQPELLEVLFKIEGIALSGSGLTRYFINTRGGVRYIETAEFQDLGNGFARFYKEIDFPIDCRVELLGFQKTSATILDVPIKITIEEARATKLQNIINENPSLINTQTKRTEEFIKSYIPEEGKITEIIVSADESHPTAAFKGKNAVQLAINSITDASENNKYVITPLPGLYKITNSNEFIGNPGYPAMIVMKDYVDVIGRDAENTIFWAELPYEDSDINTSVARTLHQTVWHWAKSFMKNVTIIGKDIRYTVHQDSSNTANKHRGYENVINIFIGNKGFLRPWGLGTWSGETNEVIGGKTISSTSACWSCHNNTAFTKPSSWSFKNHKFVSPSSKIILYPESCGSLLKDLLDLQGCSFDGGYIMEYRDNWLTGASGNSSFDHAEWRITGHSNSPFLFENMINKGLSLRIKSITTGINSTVRFDKTSTAFNSIIKNPRTNDINLIYPESNYIDGYISKDGSIGLSGWANGCVDLYGSAYTYDSGVNYTSIGRRLGDCSTINKNLKVIVDGVEVDIIFNQDYTTVSNTDILAYINTQLTGKAIAELYIYGREYYPEFTDVLEIVTNNSTTTPILKGTVLTKIGARVRPAESSDEIAGVALDTIPVFSSTGGMIKGTGRMLKRGYISTDNTQAFFVRSSKAAVIGDRFSVSAGVLTPDANGRVSVVDDAIVSINI